MKDFDFSGQGLEFAWLLIWTSIVTMITFGLFGPWAMSYTLGWIASKVKVGGRAVNFTGTGGGVFVEYLKIFILTVVTFGIYAPWGACALYRWVFDHLNFVD